MKHTLICWEHNVSKRDAWVCYHENVEWFLIMRVWVSICVGFAWFVTACSRAHFVTLLYLRTSRPTSCLGVSHDNEEIRISENEPNIVDNRENRWLRWVQHSDPSYKDKAWGPIWQHPVCSQTTWLCDDRRSVGEEKVSRAQFMCEPHTHIIIRSISRWHMDKISDFKKAEL